ncbi:MAG: 30S ribosomal protein S6 [Deltaproteobacteria bacterium]|nr:30S ribosomal protein S6 [Deltaproteobacteria bacterium]
MRRYETVFIADPDLDDESRGALFERLRGIVEQGESFIVRFDEWGNRKTAYEIKKKKRGYYVLMEYCGTADQVSELERVMRIDDRVLKYLTILLADRVDVEEVREEMAREQAEKEARERERAEAKAAAEARKAEAEAAAAEEEARKAAEAEEQAKTAEAEEGEEQAPAEPETQEETPEE